MDQPASRLSVIVVRLSILTVQPPAAPAAWRPQLPAAVRTRPALLPPSRPARRRLAAAAVLIAAVVLFATAPAWVADQVVGSGLWDLAGRFAAGAPQPDLPPHPLPLVLGSIVVLAAMSSSCGPRHRDRW